MLRFYTFSLSAKKRNYLFNVFLNKEKKRRRTSYMSLSLFRSRFKILVVTFVQWPEKRQRSQQKVKLAYHEERRRTGKVQEPSISNYPSPDNGPALAFPSSPQLVVGNFPLWN